MCRDGMDNCRIAEQHLQGTQRQTSVHLPAAATLQFISRPQPSSYPKEPRAFGPTLRARKWCSQLVSCFCSLNTGLKIITMLISSQHELTTLPGKADKYRWNKVYQRCWKAMNQSLFWSTLYVTCTLETSEIYSYRRNFKAYYLHVCKIGK